MKTLKIIRSALVAIVAAGTLTTFAAPAFAADDVAQTRVSIHGLNLADAVDRGLVQQQIRAGARKVCGTADGEPLAERQAARRCYRDAIKNGNAQLASIEAHRGTALASR
jgi:UrcA family protein